MVDVIDVRLPSVRRPRVGATPPLPIEEQEQRGRRPFSPLSRRHYFPVDTALCDTTPYWARQETLLNLMPGIHLGG
jgi:hypothetical protein